MLFLIENWFEILGVASGLLCVLLLIRENVLNFPIGLIYALITTVVVTRANLYADALLNVYYVLMNAYGWYYWMRGGWNGVVLIVLWLRVSRPNVLAIVVDYSRRQFVIGLGVRSLYRRRFELCR